MGSYSCDMTGQPRASGTHRQMAAGRWVAGLTVLWLVAAAWLFVHFVELAGTGFAAELTTVDRDALNQQLSLTAFALGAVMLGTPLVIASVANRGGLRAVGGVYFGLALLVGLPVVFLLYRMMGR